jgi:hypothetical protein
VICSSSPAVWSEWDANGERYLISGYPDVGVRDGFIRAQAKGECSLSLNEFVN